MAKNAPPEVIASLGAEMRKLAESGIAKRALGVGAKAPEFSLPDPRGVAVTLSTLLQKGPVVVTFYRGGWCPFCDLQLRAYQEILPGIRRLGAELVAISPQTAPNSRKSVRQNKLSFPILSDVKGKVGAAFGLRFNLPDYLVELYKQLRNDLPTFNDDPSWTLPMPARYVIGQDGVILYSEVNPDYTRRPEPDDMIPVLQRAAAVKV